ncbi:MAG: hypothetical protein HKN31_11870 [Pricia sp.]|nr:hypothetical protein [Pricia sp.]
MFGQKLLILLLFSALTFAQDSIKVSLFNEDINQFLNVRDFTMSKDGKEAFFTIQDINGKISQIASLTKRNGIWSDPKLLPINDTFSYLEPFLSEDGKRLFFVSDRPIDKASKSKKDFDIWYVERNSKNERWSKPINIGPPVNTKGDEFYPTQSTNKNLYFTLDAPDGIGKDDIYFAEWNGERYTTPVILNGNVNSEGYEFNAFISKDEKFLLYTKYNSDDGYGSGDLYISKQDASGNWQAAENLGNQINSEYMEYCPFYDEQNKMLYFTSRRSSLVPKDFKNINDLKAYLNEGENGLSKIYSVRLDLE